MRIDFSTVDRRTAYFWLASTIAPRPVAWVSTVSADGVHNLAPFSFFQLVTPSPPTLMLSPQRGPDDGLKDTARNIEATGEFVVNLVAYDMVGAMNTTSFPFAPHEDEFARGGVRSAPSERVAPLRVAEAPVSFECRLTSLQHYPAAAPSCAIILGEVLLAHVNADLLAADGTVDPARLDVVSRMGADWYGRTSSPTNFQLPRPT